jgi:acetyl-CoA carboxylase biotin carboxylase subunit
VSSAGEARAVADHIGYPVLLKAAAGGGGRGMFRVDSGDELDGRFSTAAGEAAAAFGDGRLYVERFVDNARHVEVQVLADRDGRIVHLGDRDCSVQRRFQKMVEEAPSAVLSPELHERLGAAAVALGGALGYTGAGTVEFLVDLDRGEFSFLEINTRLQVEHPVTEQVTGVDIVREQLRIAAGRPLSFTQDEVVIRGHTIECRVNAEDADGGFVPSPGVIERWCPPTGEGVRLDTHVVEGYEVTPYYDSMIAKLIVTGADRGHAVDAMIAALDAFVIDGVDTTLDILRRIVDHPDFRADAVDTTWLERVVLDHADAASGAPLAGGG